MNLRGEKKTTNCEEKKKTKRFCGIFEKKKIKNNKTFKWNNQPVKIPTKLKMNKMGSSANSIQSQSRTTSLYSIDQILGNNNTQQDNQPVFGEWQFIFFTWNHLIYRKFHFECGFFDLKQTNAEIYTKGYTTHSYHLLMQCFFGRRQDFLIKLNW